MTVETFYRPEELSREPRALPAQTYNLAYLLLKHGEDGCLFVPIRSMQYLAVLDSEEFIFVDGGGPRSMELAWQNFRPQQRVALTDPVPYEVVYYSDSAYSVMARLQSEFHKALNNLERKHKSPTVTRVIKLHGRSD